MARPKNTVEWSIYLAAQEFGINERTLNTRLSGVKPAFKDKYSTAQIIAAKFGDIQGARLRKLSAEADAAQISVEKEKGILIERAHNDATLRLAFINQKQFIECIEWLTPEQKIEILNGLHTSINNPVEQREGEEYEGRNISELVDSQAAPAT